MVGYDGSYESAHERMTVATSQAVMMIRTDGEGNKACGRLLLAISILCVSYTSRDPAMWAHISKVRVSH